MAIKPLALSALPKRKAPERTWDREAAEAILAVVSGDMIPVDGGDPSPPTATDGESYSDEKLARAEANKAKRLLAHVLPDGKVAKTATFGIDKDGNAVLASAATNGYGWAVWMVDAPEPKAEAAPAKSKGK